MINYILVLHSFHIFFFIGLDLHRWEQMKSFPKQIYHIWFLKYDIVSTITISHYVSNSYIFRHYLYR